MSDETGREPQRDMNMSSFGEILQKFARQGFPIEAVVFFDDSGETIDYYTYQDPYATRLAAAHHGIIFESVRARLGWLKLGDVEMVEIHATERDSVVLRIGQEYFVMAVLPPGLIDAELHRALEELAADLRVEMGI